MNWLADPDPLLWLCLLLCGGAVWSFLAVIAFDLHRYLEARRVVHYRWTRMSQVEQALKEEAAKEEQFLHMLRG